MTNSYVRNIIGAIIEPNKDKNIIMVYKNKLDESDEIMIKKLAIEYRKTIIFATMHDIIFNNNDKNVLVIE